MTSSDVFYQLLEKNKVTIETIHELLMNPDNKSHFIVENDNEFVIHYLYSLRAGTLPKSLDKNHPYAKYFTNPVKVHLQNVSCSSMFGWNYVKYVTIKFFTNEHIEQCAKDMINHAIDMMVKNNSYKWTFDTLRLKNYEAEFEYMLPILELSDFHVTHNKFNDSLSFICKK
jgi:hypothetical protein